MADNLLYEMASMSETTTEPFVKREVVYVLDQQQGNYNTQITFETSSLSNSGKWAAWNETWLTIPLVIAWQSDQDITAMANPWQVGLKNGFSSLIHSIQVDYNNTTVVQTTSFSNLWMNFKLLSTWSQDDLVKYGALLNFFPDNATSFSYAATSVSGPGLTNNRIYATAPDYSTAGAKASLVNDGLYKRLQNCAYATGATSYNGVPAHFYTTPTTTGVSNFRTTGAGANRVYQNDILAIIPFKFLHDFFDKMPLVKGTFMKITINYNSSLNVVNYTGAAAIAGATSTTISVANVATLDLITAVGNNPQAVTAQAPVTIAGTYTAATPQQTATFTHGSSTILTGSTNPLMVASAALYNPNGGISAAGDGALTFACGINKTTTPASQTHSIMNNCRIYCPLYTMNPTFEDQYLSLHPTKEIVYRDIYNYNFYGKGAGADITTLINNAITNPKTLLIVPLLNATSNSPNTLSAIQSPYTTEPCTTSPLAVIKQFNVQVSGVNIYQANFQYDFEEFLNEVSKTGINGGLTTGLSSGLIGQKEFQFGYRFYLVDLSRRLPLDDSVAKAIQIIGQNASDATMDYYTFIEIQKAITLDLQTGALIPQ